MVEKHRERDGLGMTGFAVSPPSAVTVLATVPQLLDDLHLSLGPPEFVAGHLDQFGQDLLASLEFTPEFTVPVVRVTLDTDPLNVKASPVPELPLEIEPVEFLSADHPGLVGESPFASLGQPQRLSTNVASSGPELDQRFEADVERFGLASHGRSGGEVQAALLTDSGSFDMTARARSWSRREVSANGVHSVASCCNSESISDSSLIAASTSGSAPAR